MSDLYGMDVKADYVMRAGMAIAVGSRTSIGVIKGLDNGPALPPIHVYREWPHWLCWLFGHEPTRYVDDPSVMHLRCYCGKVEETELSFYTRPWTWRYRRFVARAWRWLP